MQGPPFRLKCSECLSYCVGICESGGRYGRVYPLLFGESEDSLRALKSVSVNFEQPGKEL